MSDPTPLNDQEEVLFQVANGIRDFSAPALATVIGAPNPKEGELVGSGIFLQDEAQTLLVTAEHVVTKAYTFPLRAHSTGHGRQPAVFTRAPAALTFPSDLAAVEINRDLLSQEPLDISILAESSANLEDDILFVQGFAESNSRFSAIAGGIVSDSTPYATFLGSSDLPAVNPAIHFAIEYSQPDPQKDETGKDVLLPAPHGLSGSAVWKSFRREKGDNWTPQDARIVGIAHSWDQKNRCLIVTRVEVLRAFLQKMKSEKRPFLGWLSGIHF